MLQSNGFCCEVTSTCERQIEERVDGIERVAGEENAAVHGEVLPTLQSNGFGVTECVADSQLWCYRCCGRGECSGAWGSASNPAE
jgi:hypothetical protein